VEKIDNAISRHHGIGCYRNGDMNDSSLLNYMVLHFVDIMNIHAKRKWNNDEDIGITNISSCMFNSIPNSMVNSFTTLLSSCKLKFVEDNMDILCYVYGY
jgi:hypothetical protein